MIFNPFIVFKSPVIFTLLEVAAVTLPEPLALTAFTSVRSPDASPFSVASCALITKVPSFALMLEPTTVVRVPVVFSVTLAALIFPPMLPSLAERFTWLLAEVMLELALVVNLPDVAVRVAAPSVALIFALPPTVKLPVLAVTFTVLPETVPSIVPVALVTLASPDFASIFEFALVIKSLVALTLTVLPEIVPPIVPVALVTLASPDFASIFEPD
ncbi:hypothetical protein BV088_00890 [Haemophilus influenzae]|nr:hypothetical protein BV088_00890 [Haemophilus influenzae]PRL47008.1 hypothetical protein BV089_00949 [Haemophilus influenzae]